MPDLKEAFRMLDIFASCGAQSFVVNNLELEWPDHKKNIWGKHYSLDGLREKLPGIVRTAAIRHPYSLPDGQEVMAGENVIIRPTGPGVAFVQLDDLKTPEQLDRVRPAAFIIHATSSGNYQAWVAVSGVPEDKEAFRTLMRCVRKAVGVSANDKSASHATRLAGTENFKTKYGPDFPIVSIVEAHPGRVMTPPQLESMGLLAAPEPDPHPSLNFTPAVLLLRRTANGNGRIISVACSVHPGRIAAMALIAARRTFFGARWLPSAAGASRRPRTNCWKSAKKPKSAHGAGIKGMH